MMIQANSEEELLKVEMRSLQAKITCLQQLIVELLVKNQQLREALGDTPARTLRAKAERALA
jgi:hypothetical protein